MPPPTKWRHQKRDVEWLCPTLYYYLFTLMHQYQMKAAVHLRPAKPDPPLKLNAPKPTFKDANQDSAFGFKSRAPSDTAHDLDVDMGQEGDENAEENNNSESHILLLYLIVILPLKYLLLDSYEDIYVEGLSSFTSCITRLIQIRTFD